MSEYQYLGFRAIDGPVTEKNLKFMRQQSTRAEITPWSFDNEYSYGDFHGDAEAMLRRGYDFHLHYANFGTRTLKIRLPHGLPDAGAAQAYWLDDGLYFVKDKQGPGGIVCVEPSFEPGQLEDLWDPDDFLNRLLPLRAEIQDGDLRPLYLAHLAVAGDMNHDADGEKDAPVPAGMSKLTAAQAAMAEFYGMDRALLAAAAKDSPRLPESRDAVAPYETWLQHQPEAKKTAWIARLMAHPDAALRREIRTEFQKDQEVSSWPTIAVDRTIADLHTAAEAVARDTSRKESEKAARQRAKKIAAMAANPAPTLRETERLVGQRSGEAYSQIAMLLVDLREALAGSGQASLAEQQARKLRKDHPTLHLLTGELRKQGFLKK